MNIWGHAFTFLTNAWVLLGLGIAAIAAMCLPHHVIALKAKYPVVFWAIFIVALCIQFPVLFGGCWGLGMKYAEHRVMSRIVEATFALLPLVYVGLFVLSLLLQAGQKRHAEVSWAIAAFSSLVLSPFIGFLMIELLGMILKQPG